ncbi:DUF4157 domain-containing protein [Microbispora sp. H11081]|uniref:eCIS core domain-containing protein n=1 Tax=Microbispora sp. H11081 TaxID=2729107 RepID=UPI0014731F0B|nr:DUF4157 domain-containing protein [Microbispora sp. H11081]
MPATRDSSRPLSRAVLEEGIRAAHGRGRLVPGWLRRLFSAYFEVDFSAARYHAGPLADLLAVATGARAFTAGGEMFFRSGAFDPTTPGGLRLLCHEATHVAQQTAGVRAHRTARGLVIGRPDDPDEAMADICAAELLALVRGERPGLGTGRALLARRAGGRLRGGGVLALQRAIGLEIEVPIPIDKLTPAEVAQIKAEVAKEYVAGMAKKQGHRITAVGMRDTNGTVTYGTIRNPANGFRVDADHDDRVLPPEPLGKGWPIRQGSRDSIIEIVMDPPAVGQAQLTTAMTNISGFVSTIDVQTNGLTTRWAGAFPALGGAMPLPVNVGPFDYTDTGAYPAIRLPEHNLQGSVQVNIGIDLREYHSLLKWYAGSRYAAPSRVTNPAEQSIYRDIRTHIHEAVDIGRTLAGQAYSAATTAQRQQAGNFRGLRGWLTHLALYLRRGTLTLGQIGGSAKNIAPVLVKSPNSVLTTYGMTAAEQAYFTANQAALMNSLLTATGRAADIGTPLAALDVFAAAPGDTDAATLSDMTAGPAGVALTGKPLPNPTGVGGRRMGNAVVQVLPAVPAGNVGGGANTRGGLVAEFRTLPGFYDGPAEWQTLAQAFFDAAETRNSRDGISPG